MAKRPTLYNVGDVVEIGVAFRTDGDLASPDSAIAYVEAPDGTVFNSTDNPTRVAIEVGATTLSAVVGDKLDPVLSAAERTAGVGIVRVRFVADQPRKWGVTVEGAGAAQASTDLEVTVRSSLAGHRFIGSTIVT